MISNQIQIIAIVCTLAAIALLSLLWAVSSAYDLDKEQPSPAKFKPRKMTNLSKGKVIAEYSATPKKKNYKKNYKKKPSTTPNKSE